MQFKKTLLATSALMAAAAWAPQAHAIPAFARQVGMPCSACHYQHFPVLNSFGRAFKAGGFTMVGSEQKIEGDGLSIPAVLNLAFVTGIQYQKTNGPTTGTTATTKNTNNGQFSAIQYSLFMGGRVGEHVGFEGEVGLTGPAALASVKFPFTYDVGGGKLGVVPFLTDGLGPQQAFEPLSDGATPVHLFNQEDPAAISANAYIWGMNPAGQGNATLAGAGGVPANGAAVYYYTDMGFASFTKWQIDSLNGAASSGTANNAGSPTSNYLRAAWTGNVAGFDSALGFQYFSGTSSSSSTLVPAGTYRTKMSEIDGQMLGDAGGMPLTLIASYATAPASDLTGTALNGGTNAFNPGTAGSRKSFNIGAELGVIPNKATLQVGIRRASAGVFVPGTASGNATDNAIMVGATYNIALNVRAEFTYSKYSGDMYSAASQAVQGNAYVGDQFTNLTLWMGF